MQNKLVFLHVLIA